MKRLLGIVLTVLLVLSFSGFGYAKQLDSNRVAIVLADFGTTYPTGFVDILNIEKQVKKAFPHEKVVFAFTSNIIRHIWHKRKHDKKFLERYPQAKEFLNVKGPLATIADLQDAGYKTIIVQPTHIYDGEEFHDLCSYVAGLNAIKTMKKKYMPFKKLVVGRPALGRNVWKYDYHEDIKIAAKALADDVEFAKKKDAALVYMGHGNEFYSTGVYAEFQKELRRVYKTDRIFIGTVEGFPSLEDTLEAAKKAGVKKVVLKPLMVVAGDHANNDMCGKDKDSWKSTFERTGVDVICDIHGLGENNRWVNIYIQHIKDVAQDNGIQLR
ncbi:sirohydrochlorin cobaltochelatase [Hippea maritima]|uniref:Anaerobic cobalt chelatase n=1 Tax=Hippea maritima (strain ATCC 700847 / DSM 10411 / MH2) TaxID=760142 RepID=F2LU91_HIPMA|nr:sirohydrochlorin cobaltochelatase [Hippea maritima]AEA34554.1 anaerobic cobalt chelatase [Hippea maritima DSM 10411]